ncbi:MAG: hypothetical protein IJX41_06390 [Bacteroidaceae bacterium]|nr:hypothetical protein [Bacteroidaceae bacterium]
MKGSGTNREQQAQDEREKYVMAFNDTMLKIWQEQITLLGVIDTHSLLRSPIALPVRTDGRFFEVGLSQAFLEYGLWQDYGTGREIPRKPRAVSNSFEHSRGEAGIGQSQIPRGNSGDLGHEKVRGRRRWFSRKYYASVMNIKEFFADNLGRQYQGILSDIFNDREMRKRY